VLGGTNYPYDAKGLLKTAIRDDNPVIFIEHKLLYPETGEVPEEEYLVPLGVAEVKRAGEDVTVVAGDTQSFPYGRGTGGSRVMANAGPAVAQTAREVRQKATRVAAELLECAPEDVRIADGRVHVAGVPSRVVPLGRVAHAALRSKSLKAVGEPGLNSCTYFYPDTVTWAFGTHATAGSQ
jgi:CO/xanthine dehydrogenase Mo-binding subunit